MQEKIYVYTYIKSKSKPNMQEHLNICAKPKYTEVVQA